MPFILPKQDPAGWQTVADKITVGINAAGQLCLKDEDGNVTPILSSQPSFEEETVAGGSVTLAPAQPQDTAILTISGTARVVAIIIPSDSQQAGALLNIQASWPALDGFVLRFYNDVASGSPIATFTTAADGPTNGVWRFVRGNTLWAPLQASIPAY